MKLLHPCSPERAVEIAAVLARQQNELMNITLNWAFLCRTYVKGNKAAEDACDSIMEAARRGCTDTQATLNWAMWLGFRELRKDDVKVLVCEDEPEREPYPVEAVIRVPAGGIVMPGAENL